jgi:hypothetical protein
MRALEVKTAEMGPADAAGLLGVTVSHSEDFLANENSHQIIDLRTQLP